MSRYLSDCPLPVSTRSPFHHPVGAGMPGPHAFRRRPLLLYTLRLTPTIFRSPPRRGRACPARNFAPPAVNLPPLTHSPNHLTPQPACHPTPIICARQPASPQYTPCPNFTLKLCRKNQKTCKNLLTKGIPVAIIIKLSREPSPRRQPLEPLPTACTPFFEENFFKKLSENLLTNERI